MILQRLAVTGLVWCQAATLLAVSLVSDDTIKKQKALTQEFALPNGIPVVYYEIANSDILQVNVSFAYGLRDISARNDKAALGLMYQLMPMGAAGFPKAKIFELMEKYSSAITCGGGVELSTCSFTTVNDYWPELLPLFTAVVTVPSFTEEDVKLERDRKIADLKSEMQEPGTYVNEVVNNVFYGGGHPYRLSMLESVAALPRTESKILKPLHAQALNAARMRIVVVGSMPTERLKSDLTKAFGAIPKAAFTPVAVAPPVFNAKQVFELEDRKIPTAYIRLKINTPGIAAKDSVATRLMFSILDEELGNEIRTRRSLSYAVYANTLDYELGVGVITASTSKPKETLAAMHEVINHLKQRTLTPAELEEYKTVYATNYFLTLEEHSSLAGALANSFHYFGTLDPFFDLPKRLDAVSAKEIRDLANRYLVNFRVGVVYDKTKFKAEWAKKFVESNKGNS